MRKRNPQLNAAVTAEIDAEVTARASDLGVTKSKFATLIIAKWFDEGCPAVSPADNLLQEATKAGKRAAR